VRRTLVCHPKTPSTAARAVRVELARDGSSLAIAYRITGDLARVRVPEVGVRLEPERLWAHTCCELFVSGEEDLEASTERADGSAGARYVEWNFSPTGQVARFEFSGYRQRISFCAPTHILPGVAREPGALRLEVRVPLPQTRVSSTRLGLAVVLEDVEGGLSYWAMHHPADRPDFHHPDGFALAWPAAEDPAVTRPVEST
jgi:hypothetical protein